MEEREKLEFFERALAAWNKGEIDEVLAESTEDFEWDLSRSDIPGLQRIYRGREEYLEFAQSWREAMGATQVEIEEARELDDGRLYVQLLQTATGELSGVPVDIHYVQSFDGSRANRGEVFTDPRKARAAAGLD